MLKKLEREIEKSKYWDARVRVLECNFFGDEVRLMFEDDNLGARYVYYHFEGCYQVNINHPVTVPKDMCSKDFERGHIPYFMHDVALSEYVFHDKRLLAFKIDMAMLELYIVCENLTIHHISASEKDRYLGFEAYRGIGP